MRAFRAVKRSCVRATSRSFHDTIEPSRLTIQKTQSPKPHRPKEELLFGRNTTDHMLSIDWTSADGWEAPEITPYQNLQLDPAASALHYGLECFEGMKAYRDAKDGKTIRLFRPDMNMKRMNSTMDRLCLPTFDGDAFLECIKELVRLDANWVPEGRGYSLYIRPTGISTHAFIGVAPSESVKLFTILSPVGPYFPTGFKAVKLLADPKYVRAWPGGTGATKCGGNYALGMKAGQEATRQGYAQVLWLFGEDLEVTEVGTMNQFFLMKTKDGELELITAPLDGTILPGVTRDSILALTRSWGEFKVSERKYTIHDLTEACEEGRMIEAFGSGTAAIVCPVKSFHFNGKDYDIPLNPNDPSSQAGPLTTRLAEELQDIQYGVVDHEWSVPI